MRLCTLWKGLTQGGMRPQKGAFIPLILFSLAPSIPAAEPQDVGNLYALIVGVSNYRNPAIKRLNVSDKDARNFARFLEGQKALFKGVNVKLLTNEQVTKA